MGSATSTIQVSGLGKEKLAALHKQAKTLGMSAEVYAKQLIEEGISLERQARTKTFDELFAPVQSRFRKSGMSDEELDGLVDDARTRHHRSTSRKKR
jgi:hypothetical protein